MTSLTEERPTRNILVSRRRIRTEKAIPYLFIAPFFIVFATFVLWPAMYAFYASFHEWHLLGAMKFIGLKNFQNLLRDQTFFQSLGNTLYYIVAALVIQYPLALILAVVLNQPFMRLKRFFSTVYFIPVLTSSVVVAIVFTLLLDKNYGLFNAPLIALGLQPINWLGTREMSKLAVILLVSWRWVGYNMVYFQAGLSTISRELYEAAWVDGAGRLHTFFHITVPLLRPTIAYVVILGLIGGWQLFEEPYILTNGSGGPADSALSLANYLYRISIENLRMGYGSTVGLVLFVFVFLITLIQMRFFGIFSSEDSR